MSINCINGQYSFNWKIQLVLFYLYQPKSLIQYFRFWKKTVEVLQVNFRFFLHRLFESKFALFSLYLHFENFAIIFAYLNLLNPIYPNAWLLDCDEKSIIFVTFLENAFGSTWIICPWQICKNPSIYWEI